MKNIKEKIIQTRDSFNDIYRKGYNKDYPSIELVRISKILKIKKNIKVLDYGCGPGSNGLHFVNRGNCVTFVDVSEFAIKSLKKKIPLSKKKKVFFDLVNPESTTLNFSNSKFDLIICMSVYNNFVNREHSNLMLKEFARLLKKGGNLIIDFNLSSNNYVNILKSKNINLKKTLPNNSTEKQITMFFPSSKKIVLNDLKKNNFKVIDQGYSYWKVFDNFEHEIIFTAQKL